MRGIIIRIWVSVAVLTCFSCANDVAEKMGSLPNAFGKVNALTVVCDDDMWTGDVGDSIRYYYTSAFPVTPSPEPIFDVRHYPTEKVRSKKILSHFRTYLILANLSDRTSPTSQMVLEDLGEEQYNKALKDKRFNSIVGKNKWAEGQILIYLFAPNASDLIDVLKEKFSDVSNRVYDHDFSQIYANTYQAGQNMALNNDVREFYNIEIEIPRSYKRALFDPGKTIMWLRQDDAKSTKNLVLTKYPYRSKEQFSTDSIINQIERIGKHIIENDQIVINDRDLPTYAYNRSKEGVFVQEIRGIWETKNAFKGGSYITHLVHIESSNELVLLFGFSFAQGQKKRNIMQQLEIVMNTVGPVSIN